MMRPWRRFLLILLGIPLTACALQADLPAERPHGLGFAWFHDDCAPWDGSATTLMMGEQAATTPVQPRFPHLQVSVYSNWRQFRTGGRLRFEVSGDRGFAQYCLTEDACTNATTVTLQFSNVEPEVIEGRLEVLFKERAAIRGGFRAVRIPFRALCG